MQEVNFMNDVIGIVNFHSSPEIPQLTDSRPLGSTSFLGRYACCDFAMSNITNSGISTMGILVKDHQRSILKHLGSMDAWTTNTKIGQQIIMYNEPGHLYPSSNTDINNIKENGWVLYDSSASYIVVVPAHVITNIDLRPIIKEHIQRKEKITVVATKVKNAEDEFLTSKVLSVDKNGYVQEAIENVGITGEAIVSMEMYVINRTVLADMIHRYARRNLTLDLKTLIYIVTREDGFKAHVYMYDGYARCIDSFKHYMDYSFELFSKDISKQLFKKDWPIYTLTHDTPPALYGKDAKVSNSFISNGSLIEGTVINSIIARNVKVAKGAVVKDSIVFSSTMIGDKAHIENALIDKYSIITRSHIVSGDKNEPHYVAQGSII